VQDPTATDSDLRIDLSITILGAVEDLKARN
jgi:hypothetical protein